MSDICTTSGKLLMPLPGVVGGEVFTELLKRPGCCIERIVSHGQTTPKEASYLQAHDEWGMALSGRARVLVHDQEASLAPGDDAFIPVDTPHWVTFTDLDHATVWLAIHLGEADAVA